MDNGFKNANLKALNFVCNFTEVVSLANIATIDDNNISQQSFGALESNGLHKKLRWPKVPDKLSPAFVTLLKSTINKSFINPHSDVPCRISTGI